MGPHMLNKMAIDGGSALRLTQGNSETWPPNWLPCFNSGPHSALCAFILDSPSLFPCLPPHFTSLQSFLMSSSKLVITE